MQLQRYGYPRPNYVVTTASYTNLNSHNNTLMVPGLPLKPSQHSIGPQPASRSITTFWCHHPTIVAITTNLLVLSKWSSDSPFRYPSHLGGPQTSNTYQSSDGPSTLHTDFQRNPGGPQTLPIDNTVTFSLQTPQSSC